MDSAKIVIVDPLDSPGIFNFAVKVIKKGFQNDNIVVTRSGFEADYYDGIDLDIVFPSNTKYTLQTKTNFYGPKAVSETNIHLSYANEKNKPVAFDLYGSREGINFFLFMWPNSKYAIIIKYNIMMDVWKKNSKNWKKQYTKNPNGKYIAIPLTKFMSVLNGQFAWVDLN